MVDIKTKAQSLNMIELLFFLKKIEFILF